MDIEITNSLAQNKSPADEKLIFDHPHDNILIDTSSRLLASLSRLKQSHHYHDINQLRDYLLKEMSLFKQSAQNFGCQEEVTLIAQYALSATFDEIICKTSWGNKSDWSTYGLLQKLQGNTNPDEHFFVILDKISQQPASFIDVIELMYLCLNLGFEGKFKHHPLEKEHLQQVIDSTYQLIRSCRGDFDKALMPALNSPAQKKRETKKSFSIPLWSTIIFSIVAVAGMYFGFNYLLTVSANQTLQQLQTIAGEPIK